MKRAIVTLSLLALAACAVEETLTPAAPTPEPQAPVMPAPEVEGPCDAALDRFYAQVWIDVLSSRCAGCHNASGLAKDTRMRFALGSEPEDRLHNYQAAGGVASIEVDGVALLVAKPTGQHPDGHGGGLVVGLGTPEHDALLAFAADVAEPRCDATEIEEACEVTPLARRIRRLSHFEYAQSIEALFGRTSTRAVAMSPDPRADGYDNDADTLVVTAQLADQYRRNGEILAAELIGEVAAQVPCHGRRGHDCATEVIEQFGALAFRRPVESHEVERYLAVFDIGAEVSDAVGLKWVVAAMLQSPYFLYRSELGVPAGDGTYRLTEPEIATAMAYFLTGRPPDTRLRSRAEAGVLTNPIVRRAEARRLLETREARVAMTHFFTQWLDVEHLASVGKNEAVYPALDAAVRRSMEKETLNFVEHVMGASSGTLTELLTADYTFVDATLARYYGVERADGANADGFARTTTPNRSHGLLTQGGLLTVHARADGSSPVLRGKLIRERFLCQELLPPPPGIVADPPAVDPDASNRELYEQHSTDDACRGCHRLMDPIGFAFEHYDGAGRYRRFDGLLAIDATGAIVDTAATDGAFEGVGELADRLASSPDVHACLSSQWLRYGFGVDADAHACTVRDATEAFVARGLDLRELLLALVTSEHFETRAADR